MIISFAILIFTGTRRETLCIKIGSEMLYESRKTCVEKRERRRRKRQRE